MQVIKINKNDNVAVALEPIPVAKELIIDNEKVITTEEIPQGHKLALRDIPTGDKVIKYGYPIGFTTADVPKGGWIHTHNIRTTLGELLEYKYEPHFEEYTEKRESYFNGYRRSNGKAAVRNEIWVIPTVGCVNGIADTIVRRSQKFIDDDIEDIVALKHPYGCSQMGDDQENTREILADLANHPNAAGVLLLGLGCENSSIAEIQRYMGEYDPDRVKFLICQDMEDEIEASMIEMEKLVNYARTFKREKINASELIIGMKCGGSDGLSGITANPLVGALSDRLIAAGGTSILTEVPEMFGAETILMNRCQDEATFEKTVKLINDFKNYFKRHDQTIYENPSPGNKKGGISTLEDKSLGCTQKSGHAIVRDVLAYGEPAKTRGLNLLSAPGNDLVAATALASSGAHIVLFTTGRGTPFACPVPTVKISSNSRLFNHKGGWIDFNAGAIAEGRPLDEVAEEFYNFVLSVASGKRVKSEIAGFHDLAIFKQGVTL